MDNPLPLTQENLQHAVHRALRHLYDPVELRLNPLSGWLGLTRGDTAGALREALLESIAALKPSARLQEDSNAWRVYQVLCYRFEEQSSQEEVAAQMAVSTRQVRRLELTAIRALSSQIAAQHGLQLVRVPGPDASHPEPAAIQLRDEHEMELEWLRKSYTPESADLYQLVESALKTAEPVISSVNGTTSSNLPSGLPLVTGQVTTLRQILLNLLLAAAGASANPHIRLEGFFEKSQIELVFTTHSTAPVGSTQADSSEFVSLASRLARLSGGAVELLSVSGDTIFHARLSLPAVKRAAVLCVDDNEDSLRLFERHLDGTRFQFHGTRAPQEVIPTAVECGARAIVLDIMLPEIDGWELLGRLRMHPQLSGIPVIISTILPHEQLAISLGAAAFLRKPVSRESLIQLLEQLVS